MTTTQNTIIACVMMGCATQTTIAPRETTPRTAATQIALLDDGSVALRAYQPSALAVLPEAPWSGSLMSADTLPEEIRDLLTSAENRHWCAPMVPLGVASTPNRAAVLDGGWSIEFDAPGQAGMSADGSACEQCGRASYGIAGTSISSEMVADVETGALPDPVFRDGSTQSIMLEEGVASATLTVGGQDCVYQIWSFQGQHHLDALLEGMRFVEFETNHDEAVAVQ